MSIEPRSADTASGRSDGPMSRSLAWILRVRNTGFSEDEARRSEMFAILISVSVALMLFVIVYSVIVITSSTTEAWGFLELIDMATLIVLLSLWALNRAGHTLTAIHLFIVIAILTPLVTLDVVLVDRLLVLFAVPIITAGFLLRPSASYVVAGISVLGYTIVFLLDPGIIDYNIIAVPALLFVAMISASASGGLERSLRSSRASEAALRESESRLRNVVEFSQDAAYRRDLRTDEYDYIGPAMIDILGYSAEEFARMPLAEVLDHIHPDDREGVALAVSEGLRGTREHCRADYRFRDKQGRYRWVNDSFSPVADADGAVIAFVGMVRDIAVEEATRRSLGFMADRAWGESSTEFFAALAAHLTDALDMDVAMIARFDAGLQHATTLALRTREGALEATTFEVADTPFRGSPDAGICIISEGAREKHPRAVMLQDFDVEACLSMELRDSHGGPIGILAVMSRTAFERTDIISAALNVVALRAAAEVERMEVERALSESEMLLQTTIENLPVVLFQLDGDGIFTVSAGAALGKMGLTSGQVVGMSILELYADHPDILKYNRCALSGEPARFVSDVDGVVFDTTLVPAFGPGGEVTTVFGVGHEITDRVLAEERLRELNATLEQRVDERTKQLQAANENLTETIGELAMLNKALDEATSAKDSFLASMSHELRTPLNSIIGFSGMLVDGLVGELTDEQRTQIRMVHNSGRHLLELVNEVLDLSRIESGRIDLNPDWVDVGALTETVVESVRPLAAQKGIKLVADSPMDIGIRVDPSRLQQVLLNLLGNAVKFTDEGEVSLGVTAHGDAIEFSVVDTGCGVGPESIERIFDEFYQEERTGRAKSEGTGLGLSLSRKLADAMGGSISVTSSPGVGSVFTLRIPC